MATEVTMPKMGYDMTEGTILSWHKAEGDAVAKGDVLGEIETGKVNIEIEAFDAGVLRRILVGPGETVPVGTPIALIGTADEALPEPSAPKGEGTATGEAAPSDDAGQPSSASSNGSPPESAPANRRAASGRPDGDRDTAAAGTSAAPDESEARERGGRLRASPLARRVAAEEGVDLASLSGSGPGGRIVRDDVRAAAERAPAPAAGTAAPAAEGEATREPLSRMRRTIATRLSESWQQAPHIFITMAIRMDAALALRGEINAALEGSGVKVSVNDLVVKACARALRAHPRLNASWADGDRIVHGRVNVGVAVALDDGLITLTLPDADARPLSELAAEIGAKAERARAGKLHPDDLAVPSTFTVSNLGMYGVEAFTAILNPPEACILAVGAALDEAVVQGGEVAVAKVMRVTLSGDHRVVDGASAAEFLVTLKRLLEHPLGMLV